MLALGERGDQSSSLFLVSDSVKTDHDVVSEECHQAISVVDDIAPLVFGFKSYSFVWVVGSVDSNVVKLGDKFVNDVTVTSV